MPLPDQIQKGFTYADGDVVNAAGLNALVDQAAVLKGIITERGSPVTAATDDYVLITDTSDSNNLKRALVSSLQATGGVDSVNFNANPGSVFSDTVVPPAGTGDVTITLNLEEQQPRRILAGPISGANAVPSFRLLRPSDLPTDPVTEIALWDIDWTLGNVFTKTLPDGLATNHFVNVNPTNGQTITIRVFQNTGGNRHLTWDGTGGLPILWPNGVDPGMTQGVGTRDVFILTRVGGYIYGHAFKNYLAV